MGKVIAIGGGPNGGEFDKNLEKQIREYLPRERPNVLFIPYATDDFEENYHDFKEIYYLLGCEVNVLEPGQEVLITKADLIYFGRGYTLPLIEKLKITNAISYIRKAYDHGAILAGFSAGAHALFSLAGSSEKDIGYTLVEGLGFIEGCIISHYNYQDRRDAYHRLLISEMITGIGLEDHTMLVVENQKGIFYSSKEVAKGYVIQSGTEGNPPLHFKSKKEIVFPLD